MQSGRWAGRVLLIAFGSGAGWLVARKAEAGAGRPGVPVMETAPVERRDVGATVLATGVVRPRVGAQVAVGSRASGVVQRLHVSIGDRVEKGQLLAELDPVEFETAVARALAKHRSTLSERAWAEQEFTRVERLAAGGHATVAELAQAERVLQTTRAGEGEAAAAVEAARVQLGYTRIRAPISGVVGTVSTQEGETVAASFAAPTFLTIVDLTRLEVWAYVDETDIGRIAAGQRARFTVDTWPDEEFEGRVTAVRPTAELRDNVVNYVTLIAFRNRSDRVLRPEMTTTVRIVVEGRQNVVAVPNGALRRDERGTFTLVATPAGSERRGVVPGFRGSDFTEVASGLQPGDRVLLGRGECLADSTARTEP